MISIKRYLEVRRENQAFLGNLLNELGFKAFQLQRPEGEDTHALLLRKLRVQQILQLKVPYRSQVNHDV